MGFDAADMKIIDAPSDEQALAAHVDSLMKAHNLGPLEVRGPLRRAAGFSRPTQLRREKIAGLKPAATIKGHPAFNTRAYLIEVFRYRDRRGAAFVEQRSALAEAESDEAVDKGAS